MISKSMFRASARACSRCYATSTSSTPPMLLKIRKDLKTAMQNKDANRLAVLRSLLSSTLNASKTSNPINTDMQVLALLRKNVTASKTASDEFKNAGRQDLADKEENQMRIMEEYADSVKMMGDDEVRSVVQDLVNSLKSAGTNVKAGDVLRKVFSPDILGDKPVDKGDVSRIVKEVLAAS
ncbi:hypothetical protein PVAG01_09978 [Phlyctema vagabunda]|uniref:Altered inheritance of mitochondria protein 41 n=1 Tax=Phlyctema vagabunda TaxID=108571 RepID=A0ABR4P4M8_9HELO